MRSQIVGIDKLPIFSG